MQIFVDNDAINYLKSSSDWQNIDSSAILEDKFIITQKFLYFVHLNLTKPDILYQLLHKFFGTSGFLQHIQEIEG